MIFGLLQRHCPNAVKFVAESQRAKNSKSVKSQWSSDKMMTMEMVGNVMDILKQIHKQGEIEIDQSEIPAFDDNGYVVAVNQFAIDNDNDNYVTCSLLDKLVYYRNAGISDQIVNAMSALKEANIFAFETKMDILMEEHCSNVVRKLEANPVPHHIVPAHNRVERIFVYEHIFRSELLSFATKINRHGYIGNGEYVVIINGGILHYDVAVDIHSAEHIFECDIITEMTKHANSNSDEAINEHEFDPETKNEILEHELEFIDEEITEEETGSILSDYIEEIAKMILMHALSENKHDLRMILHVALSTVHQHDIGDMERDQIEKLLTQMEQIVVMMTSGTLKRI